MTISYEIKPGSIDSMAIFNVDADTVAIVLTDPTEGDVYNNTVTLGSDTEVCLLDIPSGYPDATLGITISGGSPVACGEIVLGLQYDVGQLQFEPDLGMTDYSVKTEDEWGNYTLTQRAFSALNSYDLLVSNDQVDDVFETVADNLSEPIVWVDENNSSLSTYGFHKDYTLQIGELRSKASAIIEGLV